MFGGAAEAVAAAKTPAAAIPPAAIALFMALAVTFIPHPFVWNQSLPHRETTHKSPHSQSLANLNADNRRIVEAGQPTCANSLTFVFVPQHLSHHRINIGTSAITAQAASQSKIQIRTRDICQYR